MTELLGRDFAQSFATRFAGRLQRATFVKSTTGAVNVLDPTGPPAKSTQTYAADAIAFTYAEGLIDGETVIRGDYRVAMLLNSITLNDGATAALDLGSHTSHVDAELAAAVGGSDGNAILVELVGDAPTKAGTISEGATVRLGFLPGSTTVGDIVALFAMSSFVVVTNAGTAANVLDGGDVLAPTALAGGADATPAPGIVPNTGDSITIPPPGSTTPATGAVIAIAALTHAQVTVQVRGRGV